ncbi:unnamed protein product [Bemisia tabaci]|uniref:C2H2-type domain-containing protein n=1 Tax=Bemisia tabaci TaxID=7038 RepID=A0A9P0A1G1_BEMTA|nr:unnamed protein product [Bemisia tabaci]
MTQRAAPRQKLPRSSPRPRHLHTTPSPWDEIGEFYCGACGKGFRKKAIMKKHSRYHCGAGRKQLYCKLCGKCYTRPDTLKEHILNKHFVGPGHPGEHDLCDPPEEDP